MVEFCYVYWNEISLIFKRDIKNCNLCCRRLSFYPNYETTSKKGYISLFLVLIGSVSGKQSPAEVYATFRLFLYKNTPETQEYLTIEGEILCNISDLSAHSWLTYMSIVMYVHKVFIIKVSFPLVHTLLVIKLR